MCCTKAILHLAILTLTTGHLVIALIRVVVLRLHHEAIVAITEVLLIIILL